MLAIAKLVLSLAVGILDYLSRQQLLEAGKALRLQEELELVKEEITRAKEVRESVVSDDDIRRMLNGQGQQQPTAADQRSSEQSGL